MADVTTTALPLRKDVPLEQTWNAESVFPNAEAWEAELNAFDPLVEQAEKFRGRLSEDPTLLAEWFDVFQEISRRASVVHLYAFMHHSCDTTDQAYARMSGRAGALSGRVNAALSFFEPELLAMGREKLEQWLNLEPRLAQYEHYIDDLFRRQQHVRSAEVEEVLGLLVEPFIALRQTGDLLTNADLKFKPAVSSTGREEAVAQSTINGLLNSPDRALRKTAWQHYADGYLSMKNTLASNLAAAVKADVFQARARRYPSSLEASLFRNNIPIAVFQNLLDTYRKNIPTWHRYWEVRRKALGVDELHPYDVWAPLTENDPPVPWEQAVDWVCEGMGLLGNEYVDSLRRGCLEQRWVDRSPNQGKRQGAFSAGRAGTYPFIMMSFQNNLKSMSTLAHELGHSMHSLLTWKNQPVVYTQYSLFVAEVASNFNQAMVRAHLLNQYDDPEFQIAVIEEAMSNFHRYFFIMPTLARFEQEMHRRIEQGKGVTADDLNALTADLFEEGYGGRMVVDRDRVGITWAQFGHMYQPFYVYQYATGISAANALAKRILEGDAEAPVRYLQMLAAGSSVYPLDALKIAGIDMTQPEPVDEAFAVLAGLVDRLERLVTQ